MNSVTTRSPAKLILSGEHAVVYGAPAVGVALDLYTTTHIRPLADNLITLNCLNATQTLTFDELMSLKARLEHTKQLNHPTELLLYALALFLEEPMGLFITVQTDIAVGLGLGSSASAIMSLMVGLNTFLKKQLTEKALVQLGRQAESLQHGNSSGFDLKLVLKGGLMAYHAPSFFKQSLNFPIRLINTGPSASTTAECVKHAKPFLKKHLEAFSQVTYSLIDYLNGQTTLSLPSIIKQNHQLLCKIGVVPASVQALILDLEKKGLAAKICGAGAVEGESAGIVMVVGEGELDVDRLNVQVDMNGTRVL